MHVMPIPRALVDDPVWIQYYVAFNIWINRDKDDLDTYCEWLDAMEELRRLENV